MSTAAIRELEPVKLWPSGAQGPKELDIREEMTNWGQSAVQPDRILTGIRESAIWPVLPSSGDMNQGMIIIPGGGYGCVVIDKEGLEIARYFAGLGIACFVLAYRLPAEGHESGATVPLSDAQRAIRLVRSRAREWNLDSARIGVAGFSAGGHLAASLSTRYDEKTYPERDAPDAAGELRSARPDFTVLGYPVISMREGITHWGSRECLLGKEAPASAVWETSCDERVTPATPPSFLVHAQDDGAVPVENSLRYFQALERAGVSASELHIFPEGGHGFALRESERPAGIWPILAARWLSRF